MTEEPTEDSRHEEEHFTDDVIADFFTALEPVAELQVNAHSLDVLTNMAVITLLTGQLLGEMSSENKDGAMSSLHALHQVFGHSPECYIALDAALNSLWQELYGEEYIDYILRLDEDDDSS